jgi:DNA repair exonuclease SbcCD nuclease subunit
MPSDEVLIWSDAHLYPHKRKVERLEDCLKCVDWVFETAKERNINKILFGGDLFHDRQKIDVYTYQRAFETFKKWLTTEKFDFYLLLGNHDLWYNEKTSISSVIPFSSLPGVRLVSQPERLNISDSYWDFIPFTHDPISSLAELKELPGRQQYALGHIAVHGAILHGSTFADVVIEHDGDMVTVSPSLFDVYDNVFLGHYHAEQKLNEITEYIGSPLQLSFGEAFQRKHIIAFNCKTKQKTYIENTFSPKHLILNTDELGSHDLKGNFVQLKVKEIGTTDLISMKKEILESTQVGSLEIKQQKRKIEEHVISDAKAILYKGDEMLARYIDQVGTSNLERQRLLEIGQRICRKRA